MFLHIFTYIFFLVPQWDTDEFKNSKGIFKLYYSIQLLRICYMFIIQIMSNIIFVKDRV